MYIEQGSLDDAMCVKQFVEKCDKVIWETEHFNTSEITRSYNNLYRSFVSNVEFLNVIKDKTLQKRFYVENGIDTLPFVCGIKDRDYSIVLEHNDKTICVYSNIKGLVIKDSSIVVKDRFGGYDGKGVNIITYDDLSKRGLSELEGVNVLIEYNLKNKIELSYIIGTQQGRSYSYDLVAMEFEPKCNVLKECYPASIVLKQAYNKAINWAHDVYTKILVSTVMYQYGWEGIMAIEMFYDTLNQKLYVNEIAPRVHNSAHHTIHSHDLSQFEMIAR